MTDQDVALAIAQWCSGITQREIARQFGYKNSAPVCTGITYFILKYYPAAPRIGPNDYWNGSGAGNLDANGDDRKRLAKIAFCHFMAQREAA